MSKEKTYKSFIRDGKGVYGGNESGMEEVTRLPSGIYDLMEDAKGNVFFKSSKFTHDGLVELPDSVYSDVVKEISTFLNDETKEKFKKYDFLYKRSSLLYGKPGTGKTCIVNRVAKDVVSRVNGVVIFNPNPRSLPKALEILDDVQPETTVMVVFEEMDELLKRYESDLLNVLDGETQKENIIYMATTNYIENIPERIRRPGRFSSVLEVKYPTRQSREMYLKLKGITESEELSEILEKSENFSIDELKEVVLAVKCLGLSLDSIVKRIMENKDKVLPETNYVDPEERADTLASSLGFFD